MNSIIKVFSLFFFGIGLAHAQTCNLDRAHSYVSLAGPVTMVLQELALLSDPQLKAISRFHPVKDSSAEKWDGGLFIAEKSLRRLPIATVIFHDESQELKKMAKFFPSHRFLSLATRGLDSFEVTEKALELMAPYLKNCAARLGQLRKKLGEWKQQLLQAKPFETTLLFHIGALKPQQRKRPLIMVNDGPVLFWIKNKKIKTYPSPLAYVQEAQRVVPAAARRFGLQDQVRQMKATAVEKNTWNFAYPGVLIPGISQIHFMLAFAQWYQKQF